MLIEMVPRDVGPSSPAHASELAPPKRATVRIWVTRMQQFPRIIPSKFHSTTAAICFTRC